MHLRKTILLPHHPLYSQQYRYACQYSQKREHSFRYAVKAIQIANQTTTQQSTIGHLVCTCELRVESIPSSTEESLTGKHKDGLFSISLSLLLHSAKNSSGVVPASFDTLAVAKKLIWKYSYLKFLLNRLRLDRLVTSGFTPQIIWSS
jgi:hypothetical protein